MKSFDYSQPTKIIFGNGRIKEIGRIASRYANRCLLVTGPKSGSLSKLYETIKKYLRDVGLDVEHFDGVRPNPTTDMVTMGANIAKSYRAELVIGVGGGSSIDTAKAIAVEAANIGTAWDYLYYKKAPGENTLPVIAVPTTSGTGSHVTPCAVITKSDEHDKSAIWHANIIPKVAIVDPELMFTLPPQLTAMTGFDAFAHNFEAYISRGTNPLVEIIALEGIKLIAKYLPMAVRNGADIEAREAMALADTLGGLAIASAGVTLPHGIGMQISGICPNVAHGLSLAVIYPEFMRYTWKSEPVKFAKLGHIFNNDLGKMPYEEAAEKSCEEIDKFLAKIGLWIGLKDIGVSMEDIRIIANNGQRLSDYKNNPKIASIEEMYEILKKSYER